MRRHLSLLTIALGVLATTACRAKPDSLLGQAAATGDLAQVRTLLHDGADPDEAGTDGWSALVWAVRQYHPDVLRAMLDAGADPNRQDTRQNGWTPLIHAIHTQQSISPPATRLGAIRTLLEAGADPNGPGRGGATPLIMAAAYGATDMVELLLEAGADPRLETRDGDTALRAAVTGSTDLDYFTLRQCQTDTVEVILARAPEMRLGDRFGDRLALRLARWKGCRDLVRLVSSDGDAHM